MASHCRASSPAAGFSGRARDAAGFRGGQFDLQGSSEPGDDLVLHLQEICLIGVELIRPKERARAGVDKLSVDPYACAALLRTSLQRLPPAEFPAELLYVNPFAAIGKGRRARDDEAAGEP